MKIIKHSGHVRVEAYEVYYAWDDCPGAGFGFDCDKEGNIFPLTKTQQESYDACVSGKLAVSLKGVRDISHTYFQHAVGKCECGQEVELQSSFANACKCGREYNMGGQQLAPRDQWEESWDDDNPHLPWGVMGPEWN